MLSGARVIDLREARERFADRVQAREAERAQARRRAELRAQAALLRHADAARRRWLADLARWPAAFRRRLQRRVLEQTGPDAFLAVLPSATKLWAARRRSRMAPHWEADFGFMVGARLAALRRAARDRRASSPRSKARAREELEWAKVRLLECLWSFGRRRIDREELDSWARSRLAEERAELVGDLETLRANAQRISHQRESGRAALSASTRGRYESALRRTLSRIEACEARLAELDREADPLRAIGIFPPRRRRQP